MHIELLDPARHDRAAFKCGVVRLDNFLQRTARKQQSAGFTRVWVAVERDGRTILGYYALNAHALETNGLPDELARNAPRAGAIPALYLSMIAVDLRHQGRGIGRTLLADALKRAQGVADQIGIKAVVLDVIEDGGAEVTRRRRAFYERMGFRAFALQPSRMFIAIETIRAV